MFCISVSEFGFILSHSEGTVYWDTNPKHPCLFATLKDAKLALKTLCELGKGRMDRYSIIKVR